MINTKKYIVLLNSGEKPTVPSPPDILPISIYWKNSDILIGQWAYNVPDKKWYTRDSFGIIEKTDERFNSIGDSLTEVYNYINGQNGGLPSYFELVNEGLPTEYLRLKKPLAVDYDIQAWSNTGWLPPTIWESLPIASSTSRGVIKYNPDHFELNGLGQLTLMDGVMTPAQHTHAWSDITSGVPSEFTPSPHGLISDRHTVTGLTTGHFMKSTSSTSFGFSALTKAEVAGVLTDWFEYIPNGGNPYIRFKYPIGCDYDIQAYTDSGQLPSTIWESLPIASTTSFGIVKIGAGINVSSGVMSVTSGAGMVYPPAGIPLSTGSAWGTSITNNSANWDTAYGWGNHASANYYKKNYISADNIPSSVISLNTDYSTGGLFGTYTSTSYWTSTPVSMYGMVLAMYHGDNNKAQLAFNIRHGNTDYGDVYVRTKNSSGWAGWGKIYHSLNSNIPTVDWSANNLTLAGNISIKGECILKDSSDNIKWKVKLNPSTFDIEFYNSAGTKKAWVDQDGNLKATGELTAYAT